MPTRLNLKPKQLAILTSLSLIITGCAINDSGNKPAAPPITLKPPAALVVEGTCEVTSKLEEWLQVTVPIREQFQSRLNEAAAKNASDIHDDTLYLAGLLDNVARTSTPDCGAEAQNVLTTAMSGAVAALQAYYNHTLSGDPNTALAEPQKGLSQAADIQNELITRMKNQYQLENNLAPTPSPTT
jgi:hypothetical protein